MSSRLDVVALSDEPKTVGPGVEVIDELPAEDPWSLPSSSWNFARSGFHSTTFRKVRQWLRLGGFGNIEKFPGTEERFEKFDRASGGRLQGLLTENLVVRAERV